MQIKIGQIYKVKPEFRDMCWNFFGESNSVYVRYFEEKMEVLNENKQVATTCSESYINSCYKPEHLEPLEKTLYNLEVNDFVEDRYGDKRKVLGLIESSPENPIYLLSYCTDFELIKSIETTKYLENNGNKIAKPEPVEEIKEMTVEEVSKLVGKKVKIVE